MHNPCGVWAPWCVLFPLLQNCDAQLQDIITGTNLYGFNNANHGIAPCHLMVNNGGYFAIIDSQGVSLPGLLC